MQHFLNTQHLKLRRYRESDLDNLEQLFRTHFETDYIAIRKSIFDWIASHNPAAGSETCYLVIEDNKKIIAHQGRMPVDLMINGVKERGYIFHGTLVHPEYRKKGLGLTLSSRLLAACENATDTFAVAMWMTEFTHEYLKRRGYYQLTAHYFVKSVNLASVLMRIIKNKFVVRAITPFGLCLISLYDFFLSSHRSTDIFISQIKRFDQRFDTFADEVSRKFALVVLRHSKYLNWKYIDKPFSNYTVFTAERDRKLTGYIILLPTKSRELKTGVIVDILAAPDDSQTIACLCQAAINFFRKEEVDYIQCFLTNRSFIKIFKKYLFFQYHKTPVMIANLHKHHAQELITDINNWFLTYGDSDGVVPERPEYHPSCMNGKRP